MSILCTHPGRFGDVLWALPTCRALYKQAEAADEREAHPLGPPKDHHIILGLSENYRSLAEFLSRNSVAPYLRSVMPIDGWRIQESAPITPRIPPPMEGWKLDSMMFHGEQVDTVHHLGYEGWPEPDLPRDVARRILPSVCRPAWSLDPWLQIKPGHLHNPTHQPLHVAVCWTEEWIELKMGIFLSLLDHLWPVCWHLIYPPGSRHREWGWINYEYTGISPVEGDWIAAAQTIAACDVVLACNSALHVLAVAIGKPVVMVEPNPHRHNRVFYPLGMNGPEVTVVVGNDGQPTFDARHTAADVRLQLQRIARAKGIPEASLR